METRKYAGKRFAVTIDRACATRRYVLRTFEEDGTMNSQNNPMFKEEFIEHYGFEPEWPYNGITQENE